MRRPEALRYAPLADGYTQKLIASYDWLEQQLDVDAPVHVGHIALATCLDWLQFRELPGFRAGRPRLAAWFDEFARRPSMRATPLSMAEAAMSSGPVRPVAAISGAALS